MRIQTAVSKIYHEIYPIIRGYNSRREYAILHDLQGKSPEDVRVHQRAALAQALDFWQTLPFYRRHLERVSVDSARPISSLAEEMVETLSLHHLPRMGKEGFMAHFDELSAPKPDRRLLRLNNTGGSTGTVIRFKQNYIDSRWAAATTRLHLDFIGHRLGEPTAKIWASPIEDMLAQGRRARLGFWLSNHLFISTYGLDKARVDGILDALCAFDPVLLIGYPTSLSVFGERLRATGRKLKSLRSVWSASETLYEEMRSQLEADFGAPVYNNYGSREFGGLAMECTRREGLHLNEGRYLFEFDPVSQGLQALIVTDLYNRVQPLVRYEIHDLATPADGPCSCGRGYGLIRSVVGRSFDLIRGRNGEVVTGTFWGPVLRSKEGIKQYQVVQESFDEIEIRYIPDERTEEGCFSHFEQLIQSQFSYKIQLRWTPVKEIPPLPSGKHKFIVSRLQQG